MQDTAPAVQHRNVPFIVMKTQQGIGLLQRRFAVAPNHSEVTHVYELLGKQQRNASEQIRMRDDGQGQAVRALQKPVSLDMHRSLHALHTTPAT